MGDSRDLCQQCDRSANDPRQYLGIAVPQPELEKIDLLPVGNRRQSILLILMQYQGILEQLHESESI